MNDLNNQLKSKNKKYYFALQEIKANATKLLTNPQFEWNTSHDIRHSLRMIRFLNFITSFLEIPLNYKEIFILLYSSYLHDLGHEFPKIKRHLNYNEKLEEFLLIRKEHAQRTASLILDSIRKAKGYFDLGLSKSHPYLMISKICGAHNGQFFHKNLKELLKLSNEQIRGDLLLSLIILADRIDADYRRVIDTSKRIEKLKNSNFPIISQIFWWKHYYIRKIKYTGKNHNIQIQIKLVLPFKIKASSHTVLGFASYPLIEESRPQISVLSNYGIKISFLSPKITYVQHKRLPIIPNDVLDFMYKYFQSQILSSSSLK